MSVGDPRGAMTLVRDLDTGERLDYVTFADVDAQMWHGEQRTKRSPRGELVPAFALLPLSADGWQYMSEGWPSSATDGESVRA